jgi:hypothetical protein
MRRAPLLLVLAVVLAGCGGSSTAPFTAGPTAKCLKTKGFRVTTDESQIGFVAAAAANGGLRAVPAGGNALTIAFGSDGKNASESLVPAFKRFASPHYRKHFADIFEQKRNAVLIWTVAPTPALLQTALGCLTS